MEPQNCIFGGNILKLINKYKEFKEKKEEKKAIDGVLIDHPEYIGAISVYATTLRKAGKIDDAINYLQQSIKNFETKNHPIIIELYATLGSILYYNKNNFEKAIYYYKKALSFEKDSSISTDNIELVKSNVHAELASIFFFERRYQDAILHSLERLKILPQCPYASRFFALSAVNKFLSNEEKLKYFLENYENIEIYLSNEYLQIALKEQFNDYALHHCRGLVCYFLTQMPFYNTDEDYVAKLDSEIRKHLDYLEKESNSDRDAKSHFDALNTTLMKVGSEILKAKYPGVEFEFEEGSSD